MRYWQPAETNDVVTMVGEVDEVVMMDGEVEKGSLDEDTFRGGCGRN